jgi:hypothetical protein
MTFGHLMNFWPCVMPTIKERKIIVSYLYQTHDFTNVDIILAFEHIGFVLESFQGQFFTPCDV